MSEHKVFYCTDHSGHWPVGVASIIVAQDEDEARMLLDMQLMNSGLKQFSEHPYTLFQLDTSRSQAMILNNGDY